MHKCNLTQSRCIEIVDIPAFYLNMLKREHLLKTNNYSWLQWSKDQHIATILLSVMLAVILHLHCCSLLWVNMDGTTSHIYDLKTYQVLSSQFGKIFTSSHLLCGISSPNPVVVRDCYPCVSSTALMLANGWQNNLHDKLLEIGSFPNNMFVASWKR